MSKFTELFLGGGGKVLAPSFQTNFLSSRTWTAPQDGIVVVRAMGAGGGGARGANATGGYSGSWGAKALRVTKGTSVVVSIGAAGQGRATDGDGTAGGNTTVTVNGVTYTAYGGPGGKFNPGSAPANGPSPSSNWDFGAASVKPGWAAGSVVTGGAGVDILAQGNNATTSASVTGSGGGGTGGQSSDTTGGGAIGTAAASGQPAANPPVYFDAGGGDWGISFYGGGGGSGGGGGNGGGGGGGNGGGGGGNGGGGGGGNGGGGGGIGGGGGGGISGGGGSGNGGPGYAHLKFYADMGI